ncbi:MAG: hypothetical protein HOP28_12965 [Gemmatimonadales bacterium]|nr:hypothetical protein [Gemmatimonadales bacterium]
MSAIRWTPIQVQGRQATLRGETTAGAIILTRQPSGQLELYAVLPPDLSPSALISAVARLRAVAFHPKDRS